MVKTLIHRIFKICNSWKHFHCDISKLKYILRRNMFPPKLIDEQIKAYLNQNMAKEEVKTDSANISFYKLPYLCDISEKTKKQIYKIANKLCKGNNIRLSFCTSKIGSSFSAKDKLKFNLKSCVVYRFISPGCNARYIDETTRHLITRIEEHFITKSSHIYKHLQQSQQCKPLCNDSCFKVIHSANSAFTLKLKEAMNIEWDKPSLNIQQNTVQLRITV